MVCLPEIRVKRQAIKKYEQRDLFFNAHEKSYRAYQHRLRMSRIAQLMPTVWASFPNVALSFINMAIFFLRETLR